MWVSIRQKQGQDEMDNARRLTPVEGASAWTAADLATDGSWVHWLDEGDVRELEAALEYALRGGMADAPFAREEFPLPNLGAKLAGAMDDVENGRGIALIKGIPVERYERPALRALYWGLSTYIGEAISQNSRGEMIASVTDRGNDHNDMNVRGYKTRAALAPHVDSCDMTSLLCLTTAPNGGDSLVSSSMSVYNTLMAEFPEYLDTVYQGFHHDLRGEGITGRIDELTIHAFPIFSYHDGVLSCAFNSRIMRSAREKAGPPLTVQEDQVIDLIIELAERPNLQHRMRLEPGDVQIINNFTILHARDAYTDHEDGSGGRELQRMWYRFHRPRTIVPGYGDRYNTGDRGGVAMGSGAQYNF